MTGDTPRVSVVIPTYRRRESVRRALTALAAQTLPPSEFEVVLAVDGSRDGTEAMAAALALPYELRVVSQENRGRAAACNLGVDNARGDLLVLLDDDMEPDPDLLLAHVRAHAASVDRPIGVLGAVPMARCGSYVERKFTRHLAALAAVEEVTGVRDVYTGNFSVPRAVFEAAGRFDESFAEYGNEDVDLGVRLRRDGVRLVYRADASARQHHAKTLAERAADGTSKGRTAVLLARKHPDIWPELELARYRRRSVLWRVPRAALVAASLVAPVTVTVLVRLVTVVQRVAGGSTIAPTAERLLMDCCFWVGVRSVARIADVTRPPRRQAPVPEAERNRLLRRVDWRFLCPDPLLRGVWVDAGRELTAAVRLVAGPDAGGARAPVVVLGDPGPAALRTAVGRLEPGGTCYVEWSWPRLAGARGAARRLESLGLEVTGAYWVWPLPPRSPRAWLPTHEHRALRWFAAPRSGAASRADRYGKRAIRAAWRAVATAGVVPPYRLLARRPPEPDGETRDLLRDELGDDATAMLVTAGCRSVGKVVALVFSGGADEPTAAVKYARTPEAAARLDHEEAALRHVARTRPCLPGVPRVLFRRPSDPGAPLGESVLAGTPVQRLLSRSTHESLARAVTDWCVEVVGPATVTDPGRWWARLVGSTVDAFADGFGAVADLGLLDGTARRLRTLPALRLVVEHRDLAPWNVLLDAGGRVQVLDWESAELEGLPMLDLVYYLAHAGFGVDGADTAAECGASYRESLDPRSATGAVRHGCITRYAERTGLPAAALGPLAELTWLLHARSEHRRLVEDADGVPDRARLASSTFLALWQEEARRAAG